VSTEEVARAVQQGVPHGFHYEGCLLEINFVLWDQVWVFYAGPLYHAAYCIPGSLHVPLWLARTQWILWVVVGLMESYWDSVWSCVLVGTACRKI
jgi:hypothetical protein